jgi:predicted alpha/beta hydrolase family esterase
LGRLWISEPHRGGAAGLSFGCRFGSPHTAGSAGVFTHAAHPLPFPAVVVASANDPYVDFERARKFARSWNAQLVEVGDQGHINTASGHGEWREGRSLLARMIG